MLRLMAIVFFAALACAQDVSVAEAARANRQKQAAKQSATQSETAQPAPAKAKRVFTNDDLPSAPPATAAPGSAAAQGAPSNPEPSRKMKSGLTTSQKLKMLEELRGARALLAGYERAERRLVDKPDKTDEDSGELGNVRTRISLLKSRIAKVESDLYE